MTTTHPAADTGKGVDTSAIETLIGKLATAALHGDEKAELTHDAIVRLIAEKDRLREALESCAEWMNDPDDVIGIYERVNEMYMRDTGWMRPGKDYPAECHRNSTDDENQKRFAAWCTDQQRKRLTAARAALATGLPQKVAEERYRFDELYKTTTPLVNELETLRAQLSALQADGERLDWLELKVGEVRGFNWIARERGDDTWHALTDGSEHDTLRAAIDTARTTG